MEDFGLGVEETGEEQAARSEESAPVQNEDPAVKEVSSPDVVPDKYEFDGESDAYCKTVGGVASELGLSQDKVTKIAEAIEKADTEDLYEKAKEWGKEIKDDPEIGGANNRVAIDAARMVLNKYMPNKETQMMFAQAALGCHPDFVRMLYRISKDLPKEKLIGGSRIYKNSFMGD